MILRRKSRRPDGWHRVFAWLPVWVAGPDESKALVWLETVECNIFGKAKKIYRRLTTTRWAQDDGGIR